eukprot:765101-Hanusia_phi.AAC.2
MKNKIRNSQQSRPAKKPRSSYTVFLDSAAKQLLVTSRRVLRQAQLSSLRGLISRPSITETSAYITRLGHRTLCNLPPSHFLATDLVKLHSPSPAH